MQARKDPTKYGLPNSAVDIGAILERKYIMRFMKELSQHGLVSCLACISVTMHLCLPLCRCNQDAN